MDTKGRWTIGEIPDQRGRTVLITGGNTGIGYHTAAALAARGAHVLLACRDTARAEAAAHGIGADRVTLIPLDLGSLANVRAAAERIRTEYQRIDLLLNNAGVMMVPPGRTEDGFEHHLGVNHLGHFALTGLLLDLIQQVPGGRIVTVASNAHRGGELDPDNLGNIEPYRPMAAYRRSKLANLLFTHELQARLEAAGAAAVAVAAHPGASRTELGRTSPLIVRVAMSPRARWLFSGWLMQDADAGALPTLRAAVDPGISGGVYIGPSGWGEFTGPPVPVAPSEESRDPALRRRLWERSEELTGVRYQLPARNAA